MFFLPQYFYANLANELRTTTLITGTYSPAWMWTTWWNIRMVGLVMFTNTEIMIFRIKVNMKSLY
ncbi:MAG: hypothetical protein CMB80_02875 [Flammeovirgaceae bacterium]|nr:hypothetical protein [Flammeovirgaceae bacterium]